MILSLGVFLSLSLFVGCGEQPTANKQQEKPQIKIEDKQQDISRNNINDETNKDEVIQEDKKQEKEQSSLTHEELLEISNKTPNQILNKEYEMTLYLEQQPSNESADFMSQPNSNDINTILIRCKMKSSDIAKLDGSSAQKGNYKPYVIKVEFIKYNDIVGLAYEAKCNIKNTKK